MPPTPTPDEEDEVDEQATDAVYEKPRLRVNVKDQAAASGHEAFFNTCFGKLSKNDTLVLNFCEYPRAPPLSLL